MANVESWAENGNRLGEKWPKQVSVIFVALGLDLLTRHAIASGEPVLKFLTTLRDHLEVDT